MTSWPEKFLFPDYATHSIVNIPHLVADVLALDSQTLDLLPNVQFAHADRIILLVLDAMGWNLYQQESDWLQSLMGISQFCETFRSTFPSTTAAATTSLRTGLTPAQHGLLGYRLFLREVGATGQMIEFSPAYGRYPDHLVNAGLKPEVLVQEQGLTQKLLTHGVPTYTFKEHKIINSSLSKIHDQGVKKSYGFVTFADMCVQVKNLLERKANEPLYTYAYWPAIDTLSHIYGWNHASVSAEFRTIFRQLLHELIESLSGEGKQNTWLWITADHGQTLVDPTQQIDLMAHKQLQGMLIMPPVGDTRLAYLYAQQGKVEAVAEYINQELGEFLFAIPVQQAITDGLFGLAPYHPAFRDRVGDVVVLACGEATMFAAYDSERTWKVQGWHGSLTAAEMHVPFFGYKLG